MTAGNGGDTLEQPEAAGQALTGLVGRVDSAAMAVPSVDARLEHVTVYGTGARVRRVAMIAAPLPTRVRIIGLPLAVIDDTVRVEIGGPAVATSLRVGVDAPMPVDAA